MKSINTFLFLLLFSSLSYGSNLFGGSSLEDDLAALGGGEVTSVQEEAPEFELVKIPETKKVVPKEETKKKSYKGIVPTGQSFRGGCKKSNEYEMKKMLHLVNRHRRNHGRVPLKWSTSCGKFANYIAKRNSKEKIGDSVHFFQLSNQKKVKSYMRSLGLDPWLSNFNENIAWGQAGRESGGWTDMSGNSIPHMCSGEGAFHGWKTSPVGHNKNMLDSRWRHMGISRMISPSGEVHWAQCFHK